MTAPTETRPIEQHRLDLVRVAAPVLALLSLVLAVATSNFDAKLKHSGLTLMMVCMSAYVFHVKGRPVAQRPPVHFEPFVMLLIVGFCLGTFFCGIGMPGPFGFAIQFLPTIIAIALGAWLTSPTGMAKRKEIASRSV